eukprot:6138535-Prymnesium_polylepis.1
MTKLVTKPVHLNISEASRCAVVGPRIKCRVIAPSPQCGTDLTHKAMTRVYRLFSCVGCSCTVYRVISSPHPGHRAGVP